MTSFPAFKDVTMLRDFMYAGKAKLSIRSEKTGKHFTYKIRKAPNAPDTWFVWRLVKAGYIYLGTIFPSDEQIPHKSFRATRKTLPIIRTDPAYEGFVWFFRKMEELNDIPPNVTVYHEGKCGMCGIELTDPISIAEGYGPTCRKRRLQRDLR